MAKQPSDTHGQPASSRWPNDILLFSTADWDNPFWTNKQHMAVQFARHGYRVLYVDSLGLRRPTLNAGDARRILRRLGKALPFPRPVRPNIWRSSPLVLPWHEQNSTRWCNAVWLRVLLSCQLRGLGMAKPLIWTYNPVVADLCAALPHTGIIYHCVVDLRAAPGIDASSVAAGERRLGALSAMCFATSPLLQERMAGLFRQAIYEPNVCDYELFAQARTPRPEPVDLAGIPRPRLVFVGALSQYKVDFSLLAVLARRLPEVHWLLIGAVGEGEPGTNAPPRLPNIHLLGARSRDVLPDYLAHADVAVLPSPHNAYTDGMFPMKFFEYLAAGLPVVATALPALRAFAPLCFLAEGEEAFVRALEQVLGGERRDPGAIEVACRRYTWKARFERMEQVWQTFFAEKEGTGRPL